MDCRWVLLLAVLLAITNGGCSGFVTSAKDPAPAAPAITTQPASQAVTPGQSASFSVAATGTAPLSYQWKKSGAAISGAISSSYTTPPTTSSDNGAQFTVVVSNTVGNVTSNPATLTVNAAPAAPAITTQPASQVVTTGQSVTFSVAATGTAPLSYQWKKSGAAISGAISSSYTTPPTTSSDNGAQFTVVVSNTVGNVTSNPATLTVNGQAQISVVPAGVSFPNVVVGTTDTQAISLTNSGSANLIVSQAGVSGNGFATSGLTLPLTLSPGQSSNFNVAFAPAGVGSVSGSVSLVSNAPSSPTTIPLSGNGVAATRLLGANPTSLSFGNVTVGTVTSLSATLTNTGNSDVTISSVTVPGTAFSTSGVSAGTILTPNQSVTLNVGFAPTSAGSVTGSVTVVSDATNSPTTIALSGAGTVNSISVLISPASVTVVAGQSQQFTASVSGTSNPSVTWTVQGVGTVSASGLYTAPLVATNSTAVVTATSVADATKTASANVTVTPATTTILNVTAFGATGNGVTDDTAAINSAISALTSGATLLFPCGTYKTTSQLTLNLSNVTVDGSSCATLRNTSSGTVMVIGGSGNGNPNYGPAVALSATANELATSFTTVSSLGVSAGDYVRLQQGGKDSSTGSGDTGCDAIGCRGELVKVASVSGNTITVTTALHDSYDPLVNAARAQRILGPLTGVTVKNITFDGSGSNVYGLAMAGLADSTVSGVAAENVRGSALLNRGDFNVTWTNITVTGAGSAQCGSAVWFENQGNLTVNGMSISNENPGAPGSGCLFNGAFGFELIGSANSTITNLTVDAAGAYGRPMKLGASRWNTLNSITVKNGVAAMNGLAIHYYSSHNTFNDCVVTNNGAGTGTGTGSAGINSFGNFNQYNTFNNCTVSGNGNVQFFISGFDALRLGQDSHVTINGGSFTGENSIEPVIIVEGAHAYIHDAVIQGPGSAGILLDSNGTNACINNNTFVSGTGLLAGILSSSTTNIGSGNLLNGYSSNLISGTCTAP